LTPLIFSIITKIPFDFHNRGNVERYRSGARDGNQHSVNSKPILSMNAVLIEPDKEHSLWQRRLIYGRREVAKYALKMLLP
jgi:hypothetical protein